MLVTFKGQRVNSLRRVFHWFFFGRFVRLPWYVTEKTHGNWNMFISIMRRTK